MLNGKAGGPNAHPRIIKSTMSQSGNGLRSGLTTASITFALVRARGAENDALSHAASSAPEGLHGEAAGPPCALGGVWQRA